MDAWVRFLIVLIASAITINVAWLLIRPAAPLIAGLICLVAIVRFVGWYQGRW